VSSLDRLWLLVRLNQRIRVTLTSPNNGPFLWVCGLGMWCGVRCPARGWARTVGFIIVIIFEVWLGPADGVRVAEGRRSYFRPFPLPCRKDCGYQRGFYYAVDGLVKCGFLAGALNRFAAAAEGSDSGSSSSLSPQRFPVPAYVLFLVYHFPRKLTHRDERVLSPWGIFDERFFRLFGFLRSAQRERQFAREIHHSHGNCFYIL